MVRPPFGTALDSGRLLQVVAVVAAVEVTLRVGLGRAIHPFLYLLTPPVVAVVGLGLLAPGLRTRVLDERRRYAVDTPGRVVPRLVVVAVVGHLFAVAAGLGVFVLADTSVQAVLYGVGSGIRQPFVSLVWPVVGLIAGTALAWTFPGLVVAGVSEGLGLRRAAALGVAGVREQGVAVPGVNLLGAVGVVLAVAVATPVGFAAGSAGLFFLAAGLLTVVFVTPPFAVAVLADLRTVRRSVTGESPSREPAAAVSVGRVAAVVLLVGSLVTVAGAARMTELRPMDTPDPLGDDPDEMYATAVANTLDGSYTLEWAVTPRTDQGLEVTLQVDRADRQLRVDSGSEFGVSYLSTGTQTVGTDEGLTGALRRLLTDDTDAVDTGGPHTPPNYFEWAANPAALSIVGELPVVTGWERVETSGNETTLELTDRQDVLAFTDTTLRPDRLTDVDESRVRAVVNTETGRLVSVDVNFEATVDSGGQLVVDEQYEFDPGTNIERPASAGDPSPEASVWRLLLY